LVTDADARVGQPDHVGHLRHTEPVVGATPVREHHDRWHTELMLVAFDFFPLPVADVGRSSQIVTSGRYSVASLRSSPRKLSWPDRRTVEARQ
jgi:hypothetical protein